MTRRISVWVSATLAALLLCTLLLLAWTLGTGSGTQALWKAASAAVPGLQAASVTGRLAGPLTIRDLRYRDDYRQVGIGSIALDWSVGRLAGGVFQLERLHVTDIDFMQIKPAPPPEEEEPFEFPDSVELPVDVLLDDVVVQKLTFRSSPDAEPLVVERAELGASLREHNLSLEKLVVLSPLFSVNAVARSVTRGDYHTDATLDWELRLPEFSPATGRLAIEGGLQEMRIKHTIDPPYRVDQHAILSNLADNLHFTMETHIDDLQLRQLAAAMPELAVAGKISAEGSAQDVDFQSRLEADSPEFGALAFAARGGFRDQVLALKELTLTGTEAMHLQAGGEVSLADGTPQFELQSSWQSLRWPLQGEPQLISTDGRASVLGTPEDYTVQLNSRLELPEQTGGALELSGRGSSEYFDLSRLHVSLLDGRLDGSGRLRWVPDLEGSLELAGEGLDPSVLLPEIPGDLQLEVRASGGMGGGTLAAQLDTVAVTGSLRNRPLDLQLRGQLEGSQFQLENLQAQVGMTRLGAKGLLGEDLDLDWRLDSPDISDLLPEGAGAIEGAGHLGGSPGLPAVRATLQARDLSYARYSLAALTLDADVDPERAAPSVLELSLSDGALGAVTVNRLSLTGEGTRSAHSLHLATATSTGDAEFRVDGDWQSDVWIMQISEGRLHYGELDPWVLATPHRGRIRMDAQQLQEGCWTSGEARLCLQGNRTPDASSAAVELQDLALGYFRPLLPPGIALQGILAARATLEQRHGANPVVDAGVDAENVKLLTAEGAARPNTVLFALEPSRITLQQGSPGLNAAVTLPFVGEGGISGQVQVDPGSAPLQERPLSGELALDLRDIAFLAALSPEIERAAGALSGRVDLSGSLANPLPEGNLLLDDGALQLVTPGLNIQDISLQAQTTGPQAFAFEGAARSGEGRLALSGRARLDGPQAQADIDISGDAFQVVDTSDARVFVSPELSIAVRETGVKVAGEVAVPRAAITPHKLPESAVSASGDQVIITGEADNVQTNASGGVEADIRISLGEDVTVDGFGFKGRLDGGMVVKQIPGRPATGSGEFNIIDGEYRAYGQGLVIEQGKILFAGGPLDQPGISVRAVRRPAAGILVGVRVRGPVQAPEFDVFSEPGMSQTEQLSWLVLGRPLENTSDGEGDMLAQAATMLGLKGGNFLADKFGGDLGVDTIGFETGSGEAGAASDVNQAAFVIGKYLSPELYVSYGIGLFESVSTITLEYSLDENWKLSTESSTLSSGGDVLYTIER